MTLILRTNTKIHGKIETAFFQIWCTDIPTPLLYISRLRSLYLSFEVLVCIVSVDMYGVTYLLYSLFLLELDCDSCRQTTKLHFIASLYRIPCKGLVRTLVADHLLLLLHAYYRNDTNEINTPQTWQTGCANSWLSWWPPLIVRYSQNIIDIPVRETLHSSLRSCVNIYYKSHHTLLPVW